MDRNRRALRLRRPEPPTLVALLALSLATGCAGYGPVSPAAYDHAAAMYGIANLQSQDRLDAMAAQINAARDAGDLSQQESQWLGAILDDARDGDWAAAQAACRRMMEDQARR